MLSKLSTHPTPTTPFPLRAPRPLLSHCPPRPPSPIHPTRPSTPCTPSSTSKSFSLYTYSTSNKDKIKYNLFYITEISVWFKKKRAYGSARKLIASGGFYKGRFTPGISFNLTLRRPNAALWFAVLPAGPITRLRLAAGAWSWSKYAALIFLCERRLKCTVGTRNIANTRFLMRFYFVQYIFYYNLSF